MASILELERVGRCFGRREALVELELEVAQGEIVGLAGPNGSGKTTLLRLVAGLLRPTRGRVSVFGSDPFRAREEVMRRARFAFAPPPLYDSLEAREHLEHLARIGGAAVSAQEIEQALALVGLLERADDRVGTFSFGMRQRLVLAQALLPEPELLVLDEPTDGLDPLAVLELRAILVRLRAERGVTILMSSHLMVELDEIVDRLLVLDEGVALFLGPPSELVGEDELIGLTVSDSERASEILAEAGIACEAGAAGRLRLGSAGAGLGRIHELLQAGGVRLLEYARERLTLEKALVRRLEIARAARDGGAPQRSAGT